MRISRRAKRPADDGIVPLINIVFLLLIFFLIAGTITPRADIALTYPETRESPAARPPSDALFVSVGGFMSYRGAPVDIAGLASIAQAYADGPHGPVLSVVVDRALPAGELAEVMGALAAAHVPTVRLVTRRAGGER